MFDNFGIPDLEELLDLRRSAHLWDDPLSPDLKRAFVRVLHAHTHFTEQLASALNGTDEDWLSHLLDDLTRYALAGVWPQFPLVVIDEVHGLKNEYVQARRDFEALLTGQVCRVLGLSATPFQLRHDELLSLLKLRRVLSLSPDRHEELNQAVATLSSGMKAARDSGDIFRRRWKSLRPVDQEVVGSAWMAVTNAAESEQEALAVQTCPPRVAHALAAALDLERRNAELRRHLRPFVVRHQHAAGIESISSAIRLL